MMGQIKQVKILSHRPNLSIPKLLPPEKFYRIHLLEAPMFPQSIPILPIAGRLKLGKTNLQPHNFRDSASYNISVTLQPEQLKAPRVTIMSQQETHLID